MAERIWDKFLTESDKSHLEASADERIGFGEKPALLMIDLYRWVFGDEREPLVQALPRWPSSCGPVAWDALPAIQSLLATAREAGIPVIHTTGLAESDSGLKGWNRHNRAKTVDTSAEAKDRFARRYDFVDEVAPVPGEAVLRKVSPSAFFETPLPGHLTRLGIDTVIVAGESTSGCVRASVVEGTSYRYRMVVAEECVFDRHEAAHAMNLFDMDQKYADVLPLAEIEAWIRQWSDSRPAAPASGAR